MCTDSSNNNDDNRGSPEEEKDGCWRHAGDSSSDLDALIQSIGRDNSISCLIRCSRSDYGFIASLNQSFRSLIISGDIYRLRMQNGVIEHARDPFQLIGRVNSISCLIRCSRSDYGPITSLNRRFHSLIRSGEIYKLRMQNGVIELGFTFLVTSINGRHLIQFDTGACICQGCLPMNVSFCRIRNPWLREWELSCLYLGRR
ncbi:hypothetical protein CRYUN_Cryun29cG0101900 [Craigia yunnanensis]